jgi:hypothetical protein
VIVLDGSRVKLVRCVELDHANEDEVLGVLYPTLAYIEDELGGKARKLYLCGFGALGEAAAPVWGPELDLEIEPLRSRWGVPGPANAGLLGVLAGLEA